MNSNKVIVEKIEKICQILNELQYIGTKQLINMQRNQYDIIKGIERLQEYNEIDDMNNALVNKKINEIIQRT